MLAGADCSGQKACNAFPVRKDALPGYFFLMNGDEKGKLYVCKRSHHFVFYPPEVQREITDVLTLEPVVLPPHIVFVGHGYLQIAGAE